MKKLTVVTLLLLSLLLLGCEDERETIDSDATAEEAASEEPVVEDVPEPVETADFFNGALEEYYVRGVNPDGSEYNGEMVIVEAEVEGIYQLTVLDGGTPVYLGYGMDYHEDFMIVGMEGVVLEVLLRTPDGYDGIWFNGEELGVEILSASEKTDPLPEASEILALLPWPRAIDFEVSGTNPDGSKYSGVLQTYPLGDGAAAVWTFDEGGKEVYGGALMLSDDTFVVVFEMGVGVYYMVEEDIWRGEWYSPGNEELGVEWVTPLN